jgi:hypothetical protein
MSLRSPVRTLDNELAYTAMNLSARSRSPLGAFTANGFCERGPGVASTRRSAARQIALPRSITCAFVSVCGPASAAGTAIAATTRASPAAWRMGESM